VKPQFRTVLMAMLLVLPGCSKAQAPAGPSPLAAERTIPLEGVAGRIDHLAADLRRRRIFVAELGNGSVDVVDLDVGTSHRIGGLKEPQGVAYLPDRDELVVASGGDGTVRFFNGQSLSPAGMIQLGSDADNVRFDAKSGLVAVGYGSGAIAFIDPARQLVVSTVELPVHPEGFRLEPDGSRLFVNLPDAHTVAFVDRPRLAITKRLPAAHQLNFPLALDPASHTIAIAYRWPSRLVLMDGQTGGVLQDLKSCGDADDVAFDAQRNRVYVVCGSGSVDVFQKGAAGYEPLASVATRRGARTGLFVPELDRLFVAARANGKSGAVLMVLRP
jgi:DNA-binding beta-propeller fold protein YncE